MAAPLSDSIVLAVARLVDDSQSTREPSHSELEFQIRKAGLQGGDPKMQGQTVGKAKRIRSTLSWAYENNFTAGQQLIDGLLALLRGCGGFRETSPNFVGREPIENARTAFLAEGCELNNDGELQAVLLDSLSGMALSAALEAYVRRARRGADDAALVTGTGKDLLEATAAHVIMERFGCYSSGDNFPTLLAQAFMAVGFVTSQHPVQPGEGAECRLQRSFFDAACAVNGLRNKQGTGHGRPWVPSVTDTQARCAIQLMGTVAEWLLQALHGRP